ncbi:MAG: glycosyltransferase [Gammaproteobacteria bacterium]|nr:glycosyltransferase [Gammaproteobacteria bacterium]
MNSPEDKLYIVLISVHGLIRGHNMELGSDADTGGQTKYVVELARALGLHPDVARVDLLTQRVIDPDVSSDYAQPVEALSDNAQIIRLDCCDTEYLPKEQLWDYLDIFSDNALSYIREQNKTPHVIHSHYADAGYVGTRLSSHLSVPLIFTGHSLGRVKRRRLLASGVNRRAIEESYNISRRVNAEEDTLGAAELIITSTSQEIEEQYGLYDYYRPTQMRVIPPGTDLECFHPPYGNEYESQIYETLKRFFSDPEKPIILALSRPDQRKNIHTLVEAYGESEKLQAIANLVIVAGNRDDISDMEEGAQEVLTDLLMTIDLYDLYGKVAYPKHHQPDDVSLLYRITSLSKGVFVNPALTEPFGLTLIEAAASGLPIVATEDGGPRDIIGNCKNGYLIDPLDIEEIASNILSVIQNKKKWAKLVSNGIKGVQKHYSWKAHVDKYIEQLQILFEKNQSKNAGVTRPVLQRREILHHDRAIFSDLDQNLLGDSESLKPFVKILQQNRKCAKFGIATGRRMDSALLEMKRANIPQPDVLITSLGTEIYYAPNLTRDTAWTDHIDYLWRPGIVKRVLADLPGLKIQPRSEQSKFKISYYIDPTIAPSIDEINGLLHQHDLTVNAFISFGSFLDIIPIRASKGFALRWFADQWDIPLENILTAGGSGADEDMMRGNTLAVVVANRHDEELSELLDVERVYFARARFAAGIIEAIDHYDFFGRCTAVPK